MRTAESSSPCPAEQIPHAGARGILDEVDLPVPSADLTLVSGRRYELSAGADGDHLTVRGRGGAVLLRVLVTEAGPVLSFEGADLQIAGTRRLALSADTVSIEARRAMDVRVEGDLAQTIRGARHTYVRGSDRLEAASIEAQANEQAIGLRAAGPITLDGQHIGLNDDPCPRPFDWSAIASDPGPLEE